MEYRIITSGVAMEVVERVNAALNDGWELQGGLQVAAAEDEGAYLVYAQALVKRPMADGTA